MHSGERVATHPTATFLRHVQAAIREQQFDLWFRKVSISDVTDGRVNLFCPNEFVRDWLNSNYLDAILAALTETFATAVQPTFLVDPNALSTLAEHDLSTAIQRAPATFAPPELPHAGVVATLSPHSDTVLHSDYTFSNFVVGNSNRFAHAAASAVADAPGKSYNPFFLHGSVGLGKTHLLQAICHLILARTPSVNILYLSCESFINQFIAALENSDLSAFRNKYRNVDILLVDDIQLLANKERTQEEFFHTFNTLYNLGHQIVLSSDAPPKDIPTLQERLVSRFKMGLVVEIAPPDFETRVNILKNKARLRGHDLPTDVANFLAEQVSTNIRELEGSVTRLLGFASLVNRPVTVDLAREAMADSGAARAPVITIHQIIAVVIRHFNVKLSDLQSKRRTQSLAYPRQVCMYLARLHTNHSLEEIGGYFGGRDHTTVLYAADKISKLIEENPATQEMIRALNRQILT